MLILADQVLIINSVALVHVDALVCRVLSINA